MEKRCKSLWNGNASIGSHDYDDCVAKKETIVIIHQKKKMTVKPDHFFKFFEMGEKVYWDKYKNREYRLKYIKFVPDEVDS